MGRTEAATSRLCGDASRRATALAVAVMSLFLFEKVAWAAAVAGVGQVPWVVAVFVLPLLYTFPGTRGWLYRYRWPVLAVQAVLTWVPFVLFGGGWTIGLGGLLAGMVLLMVRGRVSWLAAGFLAGADVLMRATITELWPTSGWSTSLTAFIVYLDNGLYLFGVVRLAQIVGEVEQAHRQAAVLTAARERLRSAQILQATVGQRLAGIAARAGVAREALAGDAAEAREQISSAGAAARETVAQARAVTASRDIVSGQELPGPPPAGAVIGARLAWTVLVTLLVAYAVQGINILIYDHDSARLEAVVAATYVVTVALQLRHSGAARHGRRPRAWPVTLALQAVLAFVFFLPPLTVITTDVNFLGGSVLLLVPGRWRWAGYAMVPVVWSVLYATVTLHGVFATENNAFDALYEGGVVAVTGLVVYALSGLAGLARELEELREQVARMAAVRERLRVARDVHDLLGLGLSAIALKADLVGALIGRDNSRALAEMAEMNRICATAQADIRLVAGDGALLSLAGELTAAQQILTSAGITVSTDLSQEPVPETADEVLAPVLREAVTNVLRHSTATTCLIQVISGARMLRLRIVNDGVQSQPEPKRPTRAGDGCGLPNMSARIKAVGGQLVHRQTAGRFELTAEIPVPSAQLNQAELVG